MMQDNLDDLWCSALDSADNANDPQAIHDRLHPLILQWVQDYVDEKVEDAPTSVLIASECVAKQFFATQYPERLLNGSDAGPDVEEPIPLVLTFWRTMFCMGYALAESVRRGEFSLDAE
jgi:hypothetical protein